MPKITLPPSRKVGHLTLFREPREINPREFNALNASERLELVRAVQGRGKYDLLIEAHDAEALVKGLSSQEVYSLVREVGARYFGEPLAADGRSALRETPAVAQRVRALMGFET